MHRAGRVHNNADSLSRRPCHNDHCKFCDRYEKRYSSETLDETNKYANETDAVKTIDFGSENKLTLPNKQVTLPCIESDNLTLHSTGGEHKFTLPSIGGNHAFTKSDHGITLSDVGNFQDHKPCASYYCQEETPAHIGPISTDDSGSIALTTTSLGPGVAEVLPKEATPGTTQIGVPQFGHTTRILYVMEWTQKLTKLLMVVMYRFAVEEAAKCQQIIQEICGVILKMGHCLGGEIPEEMHVAEERLVMTSPGVLASMGLQ